MMTTLNMSATDVARSSAYRKTAWRLMPFLMLCYLCAYLDRVNVGFAKLQMINDLSLSETVYGLGAGIFFIGYFIFEVPSNLILHRIGARRWIARIMITWGLISGMFAFVETAWQFYLLRFLLGIAEAGLAPGLLLYLTYWFPSHRRARMTVLWFIAIPLSGMVGGPLSGWIMETFTGFRGWAGWRWMFILEAVPTILMGFIVLAVLKDRVEQASWLDEHEKEIIRAELDEDDQQKSHHDSVRMFLSDRRLWLLALIYFCVVMGQYALTFWLPTLIRNAGIIDPLHIGLFTSIPYFCAILAMLLGGRSGDRHRERRWHLIIPMLTGMLGLFLATLLGHSVLISLIFLSVAAAGILSASSLFWMLPTNLLGGASAAAGIAAVNCIANLAGFFSPWLIGFITTRAGSPATGMYFIAAVLLFGALCVLRIRAADVNR